MKYILLQIAQTIDAGSVGIPEADADTVITNILNGTYFLAGVIAVIVLIIAGISMVTANGEASKVAKARNQILYTVIGIVFILAAFSVTNFVIGRF